MDDKVLLGRGDQITEIPQEMWEGHLEEVPEHSQNRLQFMTPDHHSVRNYLVVTLPAHGQPIGPKKISNDLDLPLSKVEFILNELERKLFFLVRDKNGAVIWAYPVTVETTHHRLEFSTGQSLFAA